MYKIGDYVMKVNNGVCKIENIMPMDVPDGDPKRLYYLLIPQSDKGAKVYIPVDMAGSIRKALDAEEAWDVIRKIPDIEEAWISNEKQREQEYKKAIQSGNPEALVGIIKNLYFRRKKRLEQGKKSTATDERFFKLAEDHLYAELAFALGKEKEEMSELITEAIQKNKGRKK